MNVRVANKFQPIGDDEICVDTTSASADFKGLSPFYLPGGALYGEECSKNVENAWQYAKVYREHLAPNGDPSEAYFAWARDGWRNPRGVRYPMGKGAVPEYSFWDDERLDYVEARKRIYAPIYARAVVKSEAFARLRALKDANPDRVIRLRDYDGYDHVALGYSFTEVMRDTRRKMGHGFVIAMLLDGYDDPTIFESSRFLD